MRTQALLSEHNSSASALGAGEGGRQEVCICMGEPLARVFVHVARQGAAASLQLNDGVSIHVQVDNMRLINHVTLVAMAVAAPLKQPAHGLNKIEDDGGMGVLASHHLYEPSVEVTAKVRGLTTAAPHAGTPCQDATVLLHRCHVVTSFCLRRRNDVSAFTTWRQ